ncbi:hypothetical protein F4X90_06335 [Candidatus Poribacteria bacterium]|nr:hypothetical protein [Candidatus Poribacteria bacterium]
MNKKKKYRRIPAIIEAEGPITKERIIPTLEGNQKASVGDYIITDIHGQQYPCKPSIFHRTYEPIEKEYI